MSVRYRKHKRGHVAWRKRTQRQLRNAAAGRSHIRPVILIRAYKPTLTRGYAYQSDHGSGGGCSGCGASWPYGMSPRPGSRTETITLKTTPDVYAWIRDIASAMQISRNELLNRIIRDQMKAPDKPGHR